MTYFIIITTIIGLIIAAIAAYANYKKPDGDFPNGKKKPHGNAKIKIRKKLRKIAKKEIIGRALWTTEYKYTESDFYNITFEQINGREGKKNSKYSFEAIESFYLDNRPNTILIIGEAGIGKTTLCRYLYKATAQKTLHSRKNKFLPIKIYLRDNCPQSLDEINDITIADYNVSFKQFFNFCEKKNYNILLLIDGLNEINAVQREYFTRTIMGLRKGIEIDIAFLFTSRSVGVTEELLSTLNKDENIPIYEIERWELSQLKSYLNFHNARMDIFDNLSTGMQKSLCLPLFAWMFMSASSKTLNTEIENINDIFDSFIDNCLNPINSTNSEYAQEVRNTISEQWQDYNLSTKIRNKILQKLASEMTRRNVVVDEIILLEKCISEEFDYLDTDKIQNILIPLSFELINSGILQSASSVTFNTKILTEKSEAKVFTLLETFRKKRIMFIHQAIQEYLTAKYIRTNPDFRKNIPNELSLDAFWRDIPIYEMMSISGLENKKNYLLNYINNTTPDFWTASRLLKELPYNQEDTREIVINKLIDILSKPSSYSRTIEAFRELGPQGRSSLLERIKSSKYLQTVIAIPESHLYQKDKINIAKQIPDRESVWRSLGRPIYILGELGEEELVDIFESNFISITSIHLVYHFLEAILSIFKLTDLKDSKKRFSILRKELNNSKWEYKDEPIIGGYTIAINKYLGSKQISLATEKKKFTLQQFLLGSDPSLPKFEDEFWRRAHGIDVLSEISNINDVKELMIKLFEIENLADYSSHKVKGYRLVHSSILKGLMRIYKNSNFQFEEISDLLLIILKSNRVAQNKWACSHLENLLNLICQKESIKELMDLKNYETFPQETERVINNINKLLSDNF